MLFNNTAQNALINKCETPIYPIILFITPIFHSNFITHIIPKKTPLAAQFNFK